MVDDYFVHYQLNIKSLDDEHYHLLKLSEDVCRDLINKDKVYEKTKLFFVATQNHFVNEEKYMESINYPYINHHKSLHDNLLVDLNRLLFTDNFFSIANRFHFISTIRESLLKHIDHDDRQISIFLNLIKN